MDNQAIADAFSLLSKLMDLHGENSFKAKSYSIAAYNIERLHEPLESMDAQTMFGIKGIGDAIGKKIQELNETGQMRVLTEILEKTPEGVLEIMEVKGLGPKKVAIIWKELGVESLGELLYACDENRLTMYKGFGAKTQANIKESIEFILKNQDKFLYADAEPLALGLTKAIQEKFPQHQTELTGHFRRQMESIDELEWVSTVPAAALSEYLTSEGLRLADPATVEGATAMRFKGPEGSASQNLPLIFHEATEANFGSTLFNTSASEEFLSAWPGEVGPAAKEGTIFQHAGIPFIIAPRRETKAAIAESQHTESNLIQPGDIKGIIHSHSDWSDGAHTLEKMAKAAKEQGFEYLVISDHSKSAFYANGLNEERIKAQHEQVEELNAKLAPFKIFKSIESDILNDGRLDYSDSVLSTFDMVIASVHSNLRMPQEKAMARLLTAIRSPFTTILGHPTGRLLLSRKGYPVDHLELLDACAEAQVVMELNAHPRRLDMDWRWLQDARDRNVLTSIDPDAHAVEGYADTRFGVLVAQKAGISAKHNLSSFSRTELENWLAERRKRKGI
jgi:DNA polymerase (family 10)